jgi:tRNA (guanine-N1)-methyltransferase
MDVPTILTSGDHGAVARWREEQARARTRDRRPDLLGPEDGASEDRGSA